MTHGCVLGQPPCYCANQASITPQSLRPGASPIPKHGGWEPRLFPTRPLQPCLSSIAFWVFPLSCRVSLPCSRPCAGSETDQERPPGGFRSHKPPQCPLVLSHIFYLLLKLSWDVIGPLYSLTHTSDLGLSGMSFLFLFLIYSHFLFLLFFLWRSGHIFCITIGYAENPCNSLHNRNTHILQPNQPRYIHCPVFSLLHSDLGCTHSGEGWVYHVVIPKKLDFLNCSDIKLCVKLHWMGGTWLDDPPETEKETPFLETRSQDPRKLCCFSLACMVEITFPT